MVLGWVYCDRRADYSGTVWEYACHRDHEHIIGSGSDDDLVDRASLREEGLQESPGTKPEKEKERNGGKL